MESACVKCCELALKVKRDGVLGQRSPFYDRGPRTNGIDNRGLFEDRGPRMVARIGPRFSINPRLSMPLVLSPRSSMPLVLGLQSSGYRVLLGDVSSLRLDHQLEFIGLEQRIIPELEREVGRLLKLLREIPLLLQNVHRDIRMQLYQQIVASALECHPLARPLHSPHDRLRRQHSTSAIAGRAGFRRWLIAALTHPLASHFGQAEVSSGECFGAGAIARQVLSQLLENSFAIRLG